MNKIKLNNLSARKMSEKQMNFVNGGYAYCECSCYYEGRPGGSSDCNNMEANQQNGFHSKRGETIHRVPKEDCIIVGTKKK